MCIHPMLPAALVMLSSSLGGRTSTLSDGWRFHLGDPPGAEAPEFDDAGWEAVRLPHDWAISGPFDPKENGYAGKLPWKGVGWYRKSLTLDEADSGRRVYLDFDGVMAFPRVYVNGKLAGEWDYGYTSFRVDATPFVKFGAKNLIAVRADTRRHGTRWYPGAGIYRKVTLDVREPVHLARGGTFVGARDVTDEKATVRIVSTIENHLAERVEIRVEYTILDPEGRAVATAGSTGEVEAGGSCEPGYRLVVESPRRWDVTSPQLYSAVLTVRAGDRILDTEVVPFGIRTFQFTADDGFYLNGRRVQLHGVCLHHDHGPLGGAFYTRAMERQLQILREMGVNALRTSHNPPAPEVLDLCDRMGIVVWDEAFDKWDDKADRIRGEPIVEFAEKHLRSLVTRDRNHPSVVVWSIGNEISDLESNRGGRSREQIAALREIVLKYDSTRPVGMACYVPGAVRTRVLEPLDLTGWNYDRRYAPYRELFPDKPIIYSESASALSTRGFYELPLPDEKTDYSGQLQVDSYDMNAAPWADIPDVEFQLMEKDRFVAGEFVWTGFDYLGEPTPFDREAKSSYFGIVDLCGIPKDRYWLYRSVWRPDVPTVHLLPHWNWPDRVGRNVPVFVYTSGDSAELFLNGKSLGRKVKGGAPEAPVNFARGAAATASSAQSEGGRVAAKATDGDGETRWCAAAAGADAWWQVDMGEARAIRHVAIELEREAKNYGYEVKASDDGIEWRSVARKDTSQEPRYGGPRRASHSVEARARYLRIEFSRLQGGAWASIREFGAYPEKAESAYYAPTYRYRLRWNEVTYEPGELRAVAYKSGEKIGEAVVRTAGPPASIRLTPDRTQLAATGEDLCYVLAEALDEKGTLCPLADDLVRFEVAGPAEIAGVGNGNPLSLEPFRAGRRKLFHGKAMLILRTREGAGGEVRVTASSDGLRAGEAVMSLSRP
jgi:beta-galactosidase